MKVPENLLNHDATVDRHYRIIRIHRDVKTGEGKVDTIDGKFSDGMLTFETDRFSTYAIAYNDVKPVSGVSVKGGDFTLTKKGETRKLEAEINPSDATNQNVTWTSSNESVAKVDENGNVTAVGNGEAEITVKTDDGNKTAKVRIKVEISEYKVSVPKTSGVKVTPVNGKDTVSNGGSFSFKLSYGKDYDGTDAVVKVNGKVVKPDAEGIYTVENVTEDLDITVENVKRNAPELDLSKASSGTVSNIPSGVEYRVKNAGEEEFGQWTKVSKDKLENLPSGDYEFRYVGEDGVESETVSVTVPDGNSNNSGSSNGNGSDVNKPSGNGNGTNSSVSGNAGNKSDNSSSDVNGSSNSSSRTEADASDKSAAAFANASSDKKADGKKKDGKSIPPMGEAKGHGMVLALAMIVMAAAVLSEELRRRRRN